MDVAKEGIRMGRSKSISRFITLDVETEGRLIGVELFAFDLSEKKDSTVV